MSCPDWSLPSDSMRGRGVLTFGLRQQLGVFKNRAGQQGAQAHGPALKWASVGRHRRAVVTHCTQPGHASLVSFITVGDKHEVIQT